MKINFKKLCFLLFTISVLGLTSLILGIYAGIKNSSKEIDDSKLYIGAPLSHENKDVELVIEVSSNNEKKSATFKTKELKTLDNQDENLRFYAYHENPLIELNSSIGGFLLDSTNSIKVKVIALDLIESSFVEIKESGIYVINVASTQDETPKVSHSYIYK